MDGIEPAQLSFLSIYNPSLGPTDDTEHDQILYYYTSKASRARRASRKTGLSAAELQHEERNEQMRQVGLAQGMVGFARAFSDDKSVDYVDTEKARAWMHELEPGWWMVASVDLTRFETKAKSKPEDKSRSNEAKDKPKPAYDYSSRELCPQALLCEQFLRAHAIFLLHHGASLADIYARRGRQKLCAVLEKFWNRTLRQWDMLMSGNPATDIFNGMKLAAGGELGIGVGEEEWGSGERAVLEDLVHNTEGLVDVLVSRFGEPPSFEPKKVHEDPELWLGAASLPIAADGIIFSGVGAITREAQRKISAWMEWIVRYGLATYGVQDNPQATRKRQKRPAPAISRRASSQHVAGRVQSNSPAALLRRPSGIPPPLVSPYEERPKGTTETSMNQGMFDTDTVVKYMTLGIYGSSWGIPSGRPTPAQDQTQPSNSQSPTTPEKSRADAEALLRQPKPQTLEEKAKILARSRPDVIRGCFVIGMQGDLHDEVTSDLDTDAETPNESGVGRSETDESVFSERPSTWSRRNPVRTLYVERATSFSLGSSSSSPSRSKSHNIVAVIDRLRVVVYARQPFLYTFLFDPAQQPGLAFPKFYRHLHTQLTPLHKPLLRTTSPSDVRRRIWEAAAGRPGTESALSSTTAPVYDLVFDPGNGTCHTTLPNVPDLGELIELTGAPWTRAEAVAIHNLILRIWTDTRRRGSELERTARTTRGWWVVWMRLPSSADGGEVQKPDTTSGPGSDETAESTESGQSRGASVVAGSGMAQRVQQGSRPGSKAGSSGKRERVFREAFLVRRAPEKSAGVDRRRASGGLWGMGGLGSGRFKRQEQQESEEGIGAWGPGRLAEGIGIDTRRYIEGLLSLNR